MYYHIYWGENLIASFAVKEHRNQILNYWHERFAYAADEIIAKDD